MSRPMDLFIWTADESKASLFSLAEAIGSLAIAITERSIEDFEIGTSMAIERVEDEKAA
jgi:hypothetical protein